MNSFVLRSVKHEREVGRQTDLHPNVRQTVVRRARDLEFGVEEEACNKLFPSVGNEDFTQPDLYLAGRVNNNPVNNII